MTTGRYTGRKLADFGNGAVFDALKARAIVNGDVALNGKKYAAHYKAFLAALETAGWGTSPPVRPDAPRPEPVQRSTGWLTSLLKSILALFTRKGA